MLDDDQLTDILLDSDLINRSDLEQVLKDKPDDQSLYRSLVRGNLVEEQPLVELLSELLNVEYIDVGDLRPDDEVLDLLPMEMAREHETLPLKLERDNDSATLVVAMTDPIDMMAMDEVASHTGIDIRPVLAGPRALHDAIDRCYDADASSDTPDPLNAAADDPGGIEDVDPTARRPAPPPDASQDDVGASVPGRPVTDADDGQSDAVELEEADADGASDAADDAPEDNQPTRSELGRIAVERVAVSRDDLDDDGNLRPDALDNKQREASDDETGHRDAERLTDDERRERLEHLVERLDERSDTLLADDDSEPTSESSSPAPSPSADLETSAPETTNRPHANAPDQLGLRLAELSPDSTDPETRDALASLSDRAVLEAAVCALVEQGALELDDILAHSSRHQPSSPGTSASDAESGATDGNTDQGTGPSLPSLNDDDDQPDSQHQGLGQVSSEVG